MKKYTKRITCIALSVVAVAALTLAAFAAEYAAAPDFSDSPSQSVNVTTDDLNDAINDAAENENGVSVATIEADSTDNLTLSANVMKALADKEDVILQIVTEDVTIEIDASTITNTKKVNLSMDVLNTKNRSVANFRTRSDFGCDVKVIFSGCVMSETALEHAKAYSNGKSLGQAELNDDGVPFIVTSKGAKFEIK